MKSSIVAVLCGVCMWACADQEVTAPASLVAAVAEPAGGNCAAGGEAIETGADANGNGVLDASEVTATSYVCSAVSAAPGSATLVDVVAEPAGAHCASGGQAIETGVDANGNGVLDASEVSQTSYICAGANGAEPLLRIDVEPAGPHCSTGGSAIHVGIDTNGDDTLEDSEIQSTTYVCRPANPTIIDGSFTVNNSVDAAQLVGVTAITGDLTISAVGLTALDLSSLQTVSGTITYAGFSGTTLSMPALTSAGAVFVGGSNTSAPLDVPVLVTVGSIYLQQYNFTTVAFPALTNIDTDLIIPGGALTALSLPVLTTAHGIYVNDCNALTSLDFSHLTTIQNLTFAWDNTLASLSLAPTSIASLAIMYDSALTALDLSSLATVSQNLNLEGLTTLTSLDLSSLASVGSSMTFSANNALTSLSLPALTSVGTTNGWVQISNNPTLTSISAPLWTTFGFNIEIYSDPHLPTCQAQALADQINAQSRQIGQDDAACP